ncbi:hypothetical protein ACHAPU_000127 [Fusarium lateritium]
MSCNFQDSELPSEHPNGVKSEIPDDDDFDIISKGEDNQSSESVCSGYEIIENEATSEDAQPEVAVEAQENISDCDTLFDQDSDDDSNISEAESLAIAELGEKKKLVPRSLHLPAHADSAIRELPITFYFDRLKVSVPKSCVEKHPAFAAIVGDGPMYLEHMTKDRGKVIVKFLEAGVYTPVPKHYSDSHLCDQADFEDAVKVQEFAVDMSINKLAELAKGVIEDTVCQVSLASTVHTFQDNKGWMIRNRHWVKKLLVRRGSNTDGYSIGCDLQDNPASYDFEDPIVLALMRSIIELKKRIPGSQKN